MKSEIISGIVGTSLGVVGTATQTNDILQMISLVITIIGAIISFIVVPLLNVWREAKKDGKITIDEAIDMAQTAAEGLDKTKEKIEEAAKEGKGDQDHEQRES